MPSGAAPSPLPFGVTRLSPEGEGWLIRPAGADAASIARGLAASERAPSGTLLVLLPEAGTGGGLLGVFGGTKVDRAARCAALLAHGCHEIGGGVDATSQLDLAWGLVS